MKKFIKTIPISISGIALALAALGNLIRAHSETLRYIVGFLAIIVFTLFLLKLVFDYKNVNDELKSPVALSTFPTSTMAVMMLTTYIYAYAEETAYAIWHITLIIHIVIMLVFIKRFVLRFDIQNVYPSWFVVGVGIAVASNTAPMIGAIATGQMAFIIGLIAYVLIIPLLIARLIKNPISERALPTLAIINVPTNLLIAGYFNSFIHQGYSNSTLIWILLPISIIGYIIVTAKMPKLLKLPFHSNYASFTFPYIISSIAFTLTASYIGHPALIPIVHISHVIATSITIYTLIRFASYLYKGQ